MVWTGLLVAVVTLIVVTLVSRNMRRLITQETEARGITLARLFGATNLNHFKSYEYLSIQQNARRAKQENGLVYVLVYDKEGRIAGHSEDPTLVATKPMDNQAEEAISSQIPLFRRLEWPVANGASQFHRAVFDVAVPIMTSERPGRWGTVRIGISSDAMWQYVRETQLHILEIGLFSLFLGLAGSVLLSNRITTPIAQLMKGALQAAHGDLTHRISVKSGDELERLAESFNYMMDQIRQHQEARIRSERIAAVGNMVNTIVHDCRAPVTVIRGYASLLSEFELSREKQQECLSSIDFEVGRMERMLDEILHFSKHQNVDVVIEECNLDEFLSECGKEITMLLRPNGIHFYEDYHCPYLVGLNRDKFRRAILNIAANAREVLRDHGMFTITSSCTSSFAVVRMTDNGPGIPIEIQQKLFEPFFTQGKPMGVGLGMAITRRIIEEHSGEIEVESQVGQGTTFRIQLPLAQQTNKTTKVRHTV